MLGKAKGQFQRPVALDLSHTGRLFVLDDGRKRVLYYDDLQYRGEFKVGTETDHLTDLKVDRFTDRVCVLEANGGQIRSFDLDGKAKGAAFGRAVQDPKVLGEWRKPPHEEFRPRNAWSLFNAFTEAQKGLNPNALIARTQALHGLFDGLVGLN